MNTQIDNLLLERQITHGKFARNAWIAQELKTIIRTHGKSLSPVKLESLEQICNKMARILNGGDSHEDSWEDIMGYAKLSLNQIQGIDL